MRKNNKIKTTLQFHYKPGLTMSDDQLEIFNSELRRVAASCFDKIPEYQCLAKGREALNDKVIVVARQPGGPIVGFCSAVMLPVEGHGEVLHLGLTCVHPTARGLRLTHKLTSQLLLRVLLRAPLQKLWITNVACVLSSLGNVAVNFDEVFPSPYSSATPSQTHLKIAQAVDAHYRDTLAIREDADFCPNTFRFRGSVKDTVFQKSEHDTRYHHRKASLNKFYMDLMCFEAGDEVLQIGHTSLLSLARYFLRPEKKKATTMAAELFASSH